MKLLQVRPACQEVPATPAEDGRLWDLSSITTGFDGRFLAGEGVDRVPTAPVQGLLPDLDGSDQRIGAPAARPDKVVRTGLNYRDYRDHAREADSAIPTRPVVFMTDPGAVAGPYDKVRIPHGSVRADREVELAVVIGRRDLPGAILRSGLEGRP